MPDNAKYFAVNNGLVLAAVLSAMSQAFDATELWIATHNWRTMRQEATSEVPSSELHLNKLDGEFYFHKQSTTSQSHPGQKPTVEQSIQVKRLHPQTCEVYMCETCDSCP